MPDEHSRLFKSPRLNWKSAWVNGQFPALGENAGWAVLCAGEEELTAMFMFPGFTT